jgi:hypothetical protein
MLCLFFFQWGSGGIYEINPETNLKSRKYCGGKEEKWQNVYSRKSFETFVDWHGMFGGKHLLIRELAKKGESR